MPVRVLTSDLESRTHERGSVNRHNADHNTGRLFGVRTPEEELVGPERSDTSCPEKQEILAASGRSPHTCPPLHLVRGREPAEENQVDFFRGGRDRLLGVELPEDAKSHQQVPQEEESDPEDVQLHEEGSCSAEGLRPEEQGFHEMFKEHLVTTKTGHGCVLQGVKEQG